jgi:hypothetical protein
MIVALTGSGNRELLITRTAMTARAVRDFTSRGGAWSAREPPVSPDRLICASRSE